MVAIRLVAGLSFHGEADHRNHSWHGDRDTGQADSWPEGRLGSQWNPILRRRWEGDNLYRCYLAHVYSGLHFPSSLEL